MSPEAVREQVERVLSSELFSSAGRHSRLLRYLVERTLAGEGDRLKEYVLGTEVFDRSDSFDPRIDSIVRVEARRLRSRLDDYYRGPGAGDPVVITVPRGSYVPTFAVAAAPAAVTTPTVGAPAASAPPVTAPAVTARVSGDARPVRSLAVLVIIGAGMVALAGTLLLNLDRSPAAEASPKPSIAVLPFEHYSSSDQDAKLAAYLTDSMTTALARLGTVSVASRTSASQYTGDVRSVVEIAKALNVRFVMESTVTVSGDDIELAIRLVDGTRDRKVWVGEYATTRRELAAVTRTIAQEAAAGAHKHMAR
jgi:TolB-like protein